MVGGCWQRQCQASAQLHFLTVIRRHDQKEAVHFAVLKFNSFWLITVKKVALKDTVEFYHYEGYRKRKLMQK
jgi:hypothetical protein